MADFTITIRNSMNMFGGSPSSLWGSWNWAAFKWGEGTADLPVEITHLISEALVLDSAIGGFEVNHVISEALGLSSDMVSEFLSDGSGYFYVFPSDVTNNDIRAIASYTSGSSPGSNWTSAAAGSTIWS